MKLTTLRGAGRDGRLAVVAPDLRTATFAPAIAPTLIDAMERWGEAEPALRELSESLRAGRAAGTFDFKPLEALAPLPRTYQWLDGSAFAAHGELMAQVFGIQNPQSEHERHIATHVIPELHGVDPTAGPPPETTKVATVEAG